ncbi:MULTISPECIES: SagB/ThcOx family dehydrogenase [unclassified Bacillus (in: firmicutes)]|uniref:SagB/ThcOx family dehydrogenase n=1 Tax=unclassified Bacillus (in: firmicutes) TaxID=185979 RepID=UPI000BF96115|nr:MULTISPECIES: SagB/ThcOx family dehydrogenase [unclassified Bacillus (in: firmicutes)]PEU19229.1 hypothetical protein CN525_08120 [Bacillus sp. AFS014408]PFW61618.1 hypothetical protein COL20_16725 [Bacillus sp. AFS075034]
MGNIIGRKFAKIAEDVLNPQAVNWDDAPLVYKIMENTKVIPLIGHLLYQLEVKNWFPFAESVKKDSVTFSKLENVLAYSYGITRMHYVPESEPWLNRKQGELLIRRPVPSAGVLYPLELYVLVAENQEIPAGVYHYDVAHHSLALIREGDHFEALSTCTVNYNNLKDVDYAIIVDVFFWKNAYKYRNLSYRLHSVDAGVLLAQLQMLNTIMGFEMQTYFEFYDEEVAELLQVNVKEEAPYVIIGLKENSKKNNENNEQVETSYFQKSKEVTLPPELEEMHSASVYRRNTMSDTLTPEKLTGEYTYLPESIHKVENIIRVIRNRHSSFEGIRKITISQSELSTYLKAATSYFRSDISSNGILQNTILYCSIQDVEGLKNGIYQYDIDKHRLQLVCEGDFRADLQETLTVPIVNNIWQTSICFFVVGNYNQIFSKYGDRGYRLLNMEVGLQMQRLYLTASYLNHGCHTTTGFLIDRVNEILCLKGTDLSAMAFILVGGKVPSPLHHSFTIL